VNPSFVTFTGLDECTDLDRICDIADRWPVEWAVLASSSRDGKHNRYPGMDVRSLLEDLKLPALSLHLCGQFADAVMRGEEPQDADAGYVKLFGFHRVQVNHRAPDVALIKRYADAWGVKGIAQTRGSFSPAHEIDWLADRSGGNGIRPTSWPAERSLRLVGYAGGIGPDNVREVIAAINRRGPYWLDMESGVRTDDWLDLDKCEAVCRAIW